MRNLDWTKIMFFLISAPFLIAGLILVILKMNDTGMLLITKGVFLLGFGFSRNGQKKHQKNIENKIDKIEKDCELNFNDLQKKISNLEKKFEKKGE